ncbi:hypothetical protein [Paraburkholderia sp. EG304]|uniref:hypothetical protein n=1 Tax=Paraburkholderia sp. EG304 TaxID=3237015 RepID=UPI003979CEA5
MASTVLNIIGLLLVTFGGVGAALFSPAPKYNPDGSVSLIGEPDKEKRIRMHRRQKLVRPCLMLVGVGAFFQLVAMAF